ncbi:hypothetical protein O181_022043 [Austropuccinia psidii MF-1]|uniref:Uncharacterized protein n=1 Tax=Austropuccinia psidii MF-1 TaxID=1389203 RepID=A0A9Q3CEG2_9BASI|nr:hypothetical protein [Austropuccinia psidii MF-1]
MPHSLNPPFPRDPYETPLSPSPHIFPETFKITHEGMQAVNFGTLGWFSNKEINLLKNLITLRQKAIAFCEEERGVLKSSYGKPYKIPEILHESWWKKLILIPK